jgi:Secretion system C-terminal sorting domain
MNMNMKKKFILILIAILIAGSPLWQAKAQLVVRPGASLYLVNGEHLTLHNMSFVNDGIFSHEAGVVRFTGDSLSTISGSRPISFYKLEMAKSPNTGVQLQRNISISHHISFNSGLLDLNGFNVDLGRTGFLFNENEDSRITSTGGGEVLFTASLNAPVGANPGNLGAIINSLHNLGTVNIHRGHQSQTNGNNEGNSIFRYYDIIPATNVNLNATIRFHYFDTELNGLSESTLILMRSRDNTNWIDYGFNNRHLAENFVEKTGIADFSRYTLSSPTNRLLFGRGSLHDDERGFFNIYPNPVYADFVLTVYAVHNKSMLLRLYDSKGSLVKMQTENLVRGMNQLNIDITFLPAGIYQLQINIRDGKQKTLRLEKL